MPARDDIERVSSVTDVHRLAGVMLKRLRDGRTIRLVASGPNAVLQMLKASALIQQLIARDGIKLYWRISFTDATESSIAMESFVGGAHAK